MKKYLLLITLIGILIITPASAWWDPSWAYRQEHTILGQNSDNANNSVFNEQIYLQVYNTSGSSTSDTIYIENHAGLINMTDTRIVSTDDTTELYYWINKTFDDHIDLWFRPQEIIKDQGNPIYIYYGNANTNDVSDGYTTFIHYDHFPGINLNATNWASAGAGISVSNSIATLTGSGGPMANGYINTSYPIPYNSSVYSRLTINTVEGFALFGWGNGYSAGFGFENEATFDYIRPSHWTVANTKDSTTWGPLEFNDMGTSTAGIMQIMEVKRNREASTIFRYNDTYEYIHVNHVPVKDLFAGFWPSMKVFDVDLVYIRKYLNPEPNHGAWGTEESGAVAPVAAFSCIPISGTVPIDVTCTDASTNTPTSWSWNVENQTDTGFKTDTVQNPTFSFSIGGSGTFNVNMSATNAGGTDWENKTAYIVLTEPGAPTPAPSTICSIINTNITIEKGETWIKWNWSYTENISLFIIDSYDIYLNGSLYQSNYQHNYLNLPDIGSNSYQVLEVWEKNHTYNNVSQCIYSPVRSDPSAVWWPFIIGMVLLCIGYFVPLFGFLAIILLLFGFYMVYQEYTQSYIVLTYGLSVVIAMFVTAFRIGRKK